MAIGLLLWLLIDALDIGQTAAPTTAPANATIDSYAANPGSFYGRTITVSGEITDVVSTNAVSLDDQVLVITRNRLLNAQGQPLQTTVTGRDVMQVTGTAREFDLATFERDAGIDLDDNLFNRWTGRPAILATDWQVRQS